MAARHLMLTMMLFAGCVAAAGCTRERPDRETVRIGERTFHLEYAIDDAARTQGLMRREQIPDDGGMLFVFPDAQLRAFWMANCPIDIDVIFLDARGRVTALHRMKAEPPQGDNESEGQYDARLPRYPSGWPAQFAIELRSGTLDELDLSVEDRIELDLERLKRMAR